MQQRQLRLGDTLDDYCTRERRVTNHSIVAMVGPDVKQTRCTTCDAEHEYKHAKVPRQRRKSDTPAALYARVLASGPKRVAHEEPPPERDATHETPGPEPVQEEAIRARAAQLDRKTDDQPVESDDEVAPAENEPEEGPVHRPLIRATLPRLEGQPPPTRPAPDFTIRQPGGRQNRFRHGQARGGPFQGNRSNSNMGGQARGGMPRQGGGRQPHGPRGPQGPPGPMTSRLARRQGHGQKRSK